MCSKCSCLWTACTHYRYEKRQALKARFEIEQKLRRERRAKKKKVKEVQEREQSRMVRTSRRSRQEDTSKSKAMDELKAKRSAGTCTHECVFIVVLFSVLCPATSSYNQMYVCALT